MVWAEECRVWCGQRSVECGVGRGVFMLCLYQVMIDGARMT